MYILGEQGMASVFHAGEIAVQRQAGTYQGAGRIGAGIRAEIPGGFREFMEEQAFAIAASVDAGGMPWASILVGEPGFLRAVGNHTVQISTLPLAGDPLAEQLQQTSVLGLLVIDLATRSRIRLNGSATSHAGGIQLQTDEVFGNCQKYIQAREWALDPAGQSEPRSASYGDALSAAQIEWIRAADTFFIATANPTGGADASHRGGLPGFIHIADSHTLTWPDYAGNGMFQTLGNLVLNPQAGLLLMDFEHGHVLQLAGRTEIIWDSARLARFAGAERLVEFHVERVIEIAHAIPLRFSFQSYSRFNPR